MKDDNLKYKIRRKMQLYAYKMTSPEFVSKLYFKIVLNQKLDLKTPLTFNEKLQWLKLYYCPNDPLVITCADKYAVRQYIKDKDYKQYLNDLLFVWDSAEDIDWKKLPYQFVLKCNHGCGYNIVCENKNKISKDYVLKKISTWMKEDFGKYNAEPHYDKMKKKIICEKFLGVNIIDYKFFCFHGKPQFMYIAQGFGKGVNERITFFEMDGKKAEYRREDYEIMADADIPERFEEMIEISKKLSSDFPFVRVDLFEVNGEIYFSELTFTPCGGLMKIYPSEYDKRWGELIDLEAAKQLAESHNKNRGLIFQR